MTQIEKIAMFTIFLLHVRTRPKVPPLAPLLVFLVCTLSPVCRSHSCYIRTPFSSPTPRRSPPTYYPPAGPTHAEVAAAAALALSADQTHQPTATATRCAGDTEPNQTKPASFSCLLQPCVQFGQTCKHDGRHDSYSETATTPAPASRTICQSSGRTAAADTEANATTATTTAAIGSGGRSP